MQCTANYSYAHIILKYHVNIFNCVKTINDYYLFIYLFSRIMNMIWVRVHKQTTFVPYKLSWQNPYISICFFWCFLRRWFLQYCTMSLQCPKSFISLFQSQNLFNFTSFSLKNIVNFQANSTGNGRGKKNWALTSPPHYGKTRSK